MALVVVQHTGASGQAVSSLSITGLSITAGNLLHVTLDQFFNTTGGTVSDNAGGGSGNTYATALAQYTQQFTNTYSTALYAKNCIGGGSVTLTVSLTSADFPQLSITEISGADASSPLDLHETTSSNTGFGPTFTTSGTTATANEIVFGHIAQDFNGITFTEDSNFSTAYDDHSEAHINCHIATRIVSATGTQTYAPTSTGAASWLNMDIVTYKAASGASGIPPGLNGSLKYDWSNPRGPTQQLQAQPNLGVPTILTTLRGQDFLPFRQREWPVPRGEASRNVAILSQPRLSLQTTTLAGQDTYFGAPGQVQEYDWPLPIGPPYRQTAILAQPLGTPLTFVLTTGTKPFNLNNQPNPAIGPPPVQTQPLGSFIQLLLAGPTPFKQSDWPLPPPGPQQPTQTQPLGTPATFILPTGVKPFGQSDWPNPRGPQQPTQTPTLGTWLQVLLQVAPPFAQSNWPVPIGNGPPTQTQPLGVPANIILPNGVKPFALSDWPVPKGPLQPTQTQPFGVPSVLTLLAGKDAFPFRQAHWPVPRGALQPTQTQPLGSLASVILPVGATPFRQSYWPVPRGALQPTQTQPLGNALLIKSAVSLFWTPVVPGSDPWAPDSGTTEIWTPQGPDTESWTPQ